MNYIDFIQIKPNLLQNFTHFYSFGYNNSSEEDP